MRIKAGCEDLCQLTTILVPLRLAQRYPRRHRVGPVPLPPSEYRWAPPLARACAGAIGMERRPAAPSEPPGGPPRVAGASGADPGAGGSRPLSA